MNKITVETIVDHIPERTFELFTVPEYIKQWHVTSDSWMVLACQSNPKNGGLLQVQMVDTNNPDHHVDLQGIYFEVKRPESLKYQLHDQRRVEVTFTKKGKETKVELSFDPEMTNSQEQQKIGWQQILNSFKAFCDLQPKE